MWRRKLWRMPLAVMVFITACGKPDKPGSDPVLDTLSGPQVQRRHDARAVALGRQVFLSNCSRCHGNNAEGERDWTVPDARGKFTRAPPLNGSGHSWHHSSMELKEKIVYGGKQGESKMPAWKDKLSEEQIMSVIEYIQSLWPDPVYAAWYERFGLSKP